MANKKQLIMDNCLRLTAFDKATGKAKFMLTDVEDFATAVEVASSKEIADHNGTTVATIESGKSASISGNASFVNFGLLAAQAGGDLQEATDVKTIVTPYYQTFDAAEAVGGKINLDFEPVGETGNEIKFIYELNDDGTLGKDYAQAAAKTTTEFAVADKQIELPENVTSGMFAVFYDYAGKKTMLIDNEADKFGGVYIIKADVLCRDICNADVKTVVTVQSNNAKLESAYDLTWNSDSKHPFSFKVNKDFCSKNGNLMSTYVLGDEE